MCSAELRRDSPARGAASCRQMESERVGKKEKGRARDGGGHSKTVEGREEQLSLKALRFLPEPLVSTFLL